MSWVAQGEVLAWTGWPDVLVVTTVKPIALPSGPATLEALRGVARRCGLDPPGIAAMEQIHGGVVTEVVETMDAVHPGCDGLITGHPGIALTMRSADCLAIVVHDPIRRLLGLAHAGWRGVKVGLPARVVQALRRRFHSNARDLQVALGPAIGPCCYEVGPEFEAWGREFLVFQGGRRIFDLRAAAAAQLEGAGVPSAAVTPPPWCTACSPLGYSYRREGQVAGRMATFAILR